MRKVIEVQFDPKLHGGHMQHYWCIKGYDDENNSFILADGWNNSLIGAMTSAYGKAERM